MKFSEAWLRQWVNPPLERDELLHQMTMAGLEVDGTEALNGAFSDVVVAKILSADQHPDADKLRVCQVTDGEEEYQVVCGAPNARPGLLTAFAKVGAKLPGDFKIKQAKLRGVASFGMLCSETELGIGDDDAGIMECDVPIGTDLASYYSQDLPLNDVTVDVDLTPNRGDCLSLKGLAREVGVLNNLAVAYPAIEAIPATTDKTFAVNVSAGQQCPRYLGRVIEGVDLSRPTPRWMSERLQRSGLRTIDPVVDVTNYILLELGQPMHAFDLHRLHEQIDVRMAQPGDKLQLLDGQKVEIDENTLVIADASGPLALAGVMGGQLSGVQDSTEAIFLECAFFAPLAIAGTARRYGLHTDASHRYERGVDFQLQEDALQRATALLLDIVGGECGPITATVHSQHLPNNAPVLLRESKINALLGITAGPAQVDQALQRLGFDVNSRNDGEAGVEWQVHSPSHRFDIAIEADLIEEICRIYGYNNIPVTAVDISLSLAAVPLRQHNDRQLKEQMASQGFQEVITYSFVDPGLQKLCDGASEPLALANPMSSEQSVMRTTLLPGLIDVARRNAARQIDSGRAFELGLAFHPGQQLQQIPMLGGILWGRRLAESWHAEAAKVDFFDAKGAVEALCSWAGVAVNFIAAADETLHPGQSAWVCDKRSGERIGRLGRLHPRIEKQLGVPELFVFELIAAAVMRRPLRQHGQVSRFPSVRRDLAVVLAESVPAQQVVDSLYETFDESCTNISLFDVYQGEGIDFNEKSLGLGLTFQSQTTTLTEEEVNGLAQQAIALLKDQYGARLR